MLYFSSMFSLYFTYSSQIQYIHYKLYLYSAKLYLLLDFIILSNFDPLLSSPLLSSPLSVPLLLNRQRPYICAQSMGIPPPLQLDRTDFLCFYSLRSYSIRLWIIFLRKYIDMLLTEWNETKTNFIDPTSLYDLCPLTQTLPLIFLFSFLLFSVSLAWRFPCPTSPL